MDRTSPLNRAAPGSAHIRQLRKGWQSDQHRAKLKQNRHASKIVMHRTPRHALAVRELHARGA
jgi:hypothetical protein